jgi:hypothetical protein
MPSHKQSGQVIQMALGDRFLTNVCGDDVSVVVVFEGNLPDRNGWQETVQVAKLDNGQYMAFQNHGLQLTWPTTKEEAFRVMAEQAAKELE